MGESDWKVDGGVMPTKARPPLPDLGDASKMFTVELTEPEINALYSVLAFARTAIAGLPDDTPVGLYAHNWYNHYRSTLEGLDEKLKQFDGL